MTDESPLLCQFCGSDLLAEGWTVGPVYHCQRSLASTVRVRTPHHVAAVNPP